MRSLSQFQALQDGEKELASLRDLGLTDAEIQLWQSREAPETTEKVQTCWRQTSSSTQASCGFLHPNTWKDVLTVHFVPASSALNVWKCDDFKKEVQVHLFILYSTHSW